MKPMLILQNHFTLFSAKMSLSPIYYIFPIIGAIGSCFPVNAGIYLIWQDNYNPDTKECILAKIDFQMSWSSWYLQGCHIVGLLSVQSLIIVLQGLLVSNFFHLKHCCSKGIVIKITFSTEVLCDLNTKYCNTLQISTHSSQSLTMQCPKLNYLPLFHLAEDLQL